MQYLEIPVATLAGLMIFGDLPDGLAALGIVVTIAAGLYIVAREAGGVACRTAHGLIWSKAQRPAVRAEWRHGQPHSQARTRA